MLNVGYLGGGDKRVRSEGDRRIEGMKEVMDWVKGGGVMVVVI
ncbi:class I SAM-dependent methyltransferase [Bacillus altitudinis]